MPVSRRTAAVEAGRRDRLGFRCDVRGHLDELLERAGPHPYTYALADGAGAVKVGKSKWHPHQRAASLQTGSPNRLVVLAWTCELSEAAAHRCMAWLTRRLRGEWFLLNGAVLDELATWTWADRRGLENARLRLCEGAPRCQ